MKNKEYPNIPPEILKELLKHVRKMMIEQQFNTWLGIPTNHGLLTHEDFPIKNKKK